MEEMKQKAQYYFGTFYSGLDIDQCPYPEFKKWYDATHSIEATPEIYAYACFIWATCTRR